MTGEKVNVLKVYVGLHVWPIVADVAS